MRMKKQVLLTRWCGVVISDYPVLLSWSWCCYLTQQHIHTLNISCWDTLLCGRVISFVCEDGEVCVRSEWVIAFSVVYKYYEIKPSTLIYMHLLHTNSSSNLKIKSFNISVGVSTTFLVSWWTVHYLPTQVNEFLSFSLQTFVALLNINFEAFVSDIYVSWKISARSQFSKQWIMQSVRLTLWDERRKRCWCCKSSKWVQRSEWVRDGVNSVK